MSTTRTMEEGIPHLADEHAVYAQASKALRQDSVRHTPTRGILPIRKVYAGPPESWWAALDSTTKNLVSSLQATPIPGEYCDSDSFTPNSYREATTCPDRNHWRNAIDEEMESHNINKTWTMSDYDSKLDGQALRSRWVFKIKTADALITKYKARLVACGYCHFMGMA